MHLSMSLSHLMLPQSIGFTANLSPTEEDNSTSFMPFFTSNKRGESMNVLDHVEPSGKSSTKFTPICITKGIG